MSEEKPTEKQDNIKVSKIIDDHTIVINRGSKQGVKDGERFLIYSIGEEIIDPDSNKPLGKLEIIKGTGKATHVQEYITTITSDMKYPRFRTIKRTPIGRSLWDIVMAQPSEIEEYLPGEDKAFDNIKVGDFARPI